MRKYHDPFEQLLAEAVCEVAEELTKPQPQDLPEKNLTSNQYVVLYPCPGGVLRDISLTGVRPNQPD